MVIGCPGSGKSTFSRTLHDKTGIPLYHLDLMYWNADKTIVDRNVFQERLLHVIQKEEWIMDGNYESSIELRLRACDTVFFLDYPFEVCLDGVWSRAGKVRPDVPWPAAENEEDPELIDFVKSYNSESRPGVIELLNKYSDKKIYIFKKRGDAEEFLNRI